MTAVHPFELSLCLYSDLSSIGVRDSCWNVTTHQVDVSAQYHEGKKGHTPSRVHKQIKAGYCLRASEMETTWKCCSSSTWEQDVSTLPSGRLWGCNTVIKCAQYIHNMYTRKAWAQMAARRVTCIKGHWRLLASAPVIILDTNMRLLDAPSLCFLEAFLFPFILHQHAAFCYCICYGMCTISELSEKWTFSQKEFGI